MSIYNFSISYSGFDDFSSNCTSCWSLFTFFLQGRTSGLQEGKRFKGGQKKRYKDTLHVSTFQLSLGNRLCRIEQSGVA